MATAIGISLCLDSRGRWRSGRDYLYADCSYARAIAAAGGLPIHLPVQESRSAAALIERVEGLVVPGGDDFLPDRPYPEEVAVEPLDSVQIDFDRALIEAAAAAKKPVLGICYGMQLLALAAGGALHHHLPTDCPSSLDHGAGTSGTREHAIEVQSNSRLLNWLDTPQIEVNSRHHQAVADSGAMRAVAHAPDGVIEAIESTRGSPQIGVQWHPETLPGSAGAGLLRAFVALSGGAAG